MQVNMNKILDLKTYLGKVGGRGFTMQGLGLYAAWEMLQNDAIPFGDRFKAALVLVVGSTAYAISRAFADAWSKGTLSTSAKDPAAPTAK